MNTDPLPPADLLDGQSVLITGGTGSLGQVLLRRLLRGELGRPARITVFSRDEAKQHEMRLAYQNLEAATEEVIYRNQPECLQFQIGDIRDFRSISAALSRSDVVFNAAALKQVPTCEYFPSEAVLTNIVGAENIVRAIRDQRLPVNTVVGISTDKACKPVNVMGMTKAIQERVFVQANLHAEATRFVCVRYGNVLASRGSVIPLFQRQIREGGPVTITTPKMTRFLMSLDQAVDTVFAAYREALPGETYVPRVPSSRIVDIARVMIGDRPIDQKIIGIRPGEKLHEILVSESEVHRTVVRADFNVIQPTLPELRQISTDDVYMESEYSSADDLMPTEQLRELLRVNGLLE